MKWIGSEDKTIECVAPFSWPAGMTGHLGVAILGTLLWAIPVASGAAADKHRQTLSADEIRRTFVGRVASDGTHWSYLLKPDGKIKAVELGRQRAGH